MDTQKIAAFTAHYQTLGDWELFDLSRSTTLTAEARVALDAIITERHIDLDKLQREEAAEEDARAKHEHAAAERDAKRDSRITKIGLLIAIPIVVLGMALNFERSYETLVSSLVQVGVLGVVAWIVFAIRRSRNKR